MKFLRGLGYLLLFALLSLAVPYFFKSMPFVVLALLLMLVILLIRKDMVEALKGTNS